MAGPGAIPNSAPPIDGPTSQTAAIRPDRAAAAAGSWRTGTTARRAPASAAWNTAAPLPSTKAATGIIQNSSQSATMAAARPPTMTTRTASAAIISRRRSQRSATTPAGIASNVEERPRAKATTPALAADPVSSSTSSG